MFKYYLRIYISNLFFFDWFSLFWAILGPTKVTHYSEEALIWYNYMLYTYKAVNMFKMQNFLHGFMFNIFDTMERADM